MKKLFLGTVMIAGFLSFSFAQTAKPVTAPAVKPPATKAIVAPKAATSATAAASKNAATPATKPPASSGVVLKKDGTPDKRYKNSASTGPTKKDGTLDMRYKKNKKG